MGTSGVVKIRPTNNCGSGLANGYVPAIINISRPKPALTFSGNYTICTSQQFTASNVPSWVTNYNWQVTPGNLVSLINANSNPVTVTKVANGIANIKLTISNNTCPLTFDYLTQEIIQNPQLIIGTPEPQYMYIWSESCLGGSDWEVTLQAVPNIGGVNYIWNYNGVDGLPTNSSTFYSYEFPANCIDMNFKINNSCGTSSYISKPSTFCPSNCGGFRMMISPNPSKDQITISSGIKSSLKIYQLKITDIKGDVKKNFKTPGQSQITVNIQNLTSGLYYIQIFDGKKWVSNSFYKE